MSAALAVLLPSCASPQDSPSAQKPDKADEPIRLAGTEWVLKTLDGRDPTVEPFTLGFFDDDYLEGEAVCNSFGARYAPGKKLHPVEELARTHFECGATMTAHREEAEFLEIMSEADGLDAMRERLKIEDSAGGRTLVFVPKPPPPSGSALDGTEWMLVSLHGLTPVDGPRLPSISTAGARTGTLAATVTARVWRITERP